MNGYFISYEKASELGLLDIPKVTAHLQKTIIAITQNDIVEQMKNVDQIDIKYEEMANWFYKNYYDNLIDTFTSFR